MKKSVIVFIIVFSCGVNIFAENEISKLYGEWDIRLPLALTSPESKNSDYFSMFFIFPESEKRNGTWKILPTRKIIMKNKGKIIIHTWSLIDPQSLKSSNEEETLQAIFSTLAKHIWIVDKAGHRNRLTYFLINPNEAVIILEFFFKGFSNSNNGMIGYMRRK